jgi:hypothetical protein
VAGLTVHVGWADGLRVRGKRSENIPRTSSMHPPKFGQTASSPRTVRSSRTVRPHRVDGPTNNFQPKPTDRTDQNEATHELEKNTKNSRLSGSSRTVRRLGANGPPGADRAARARKRKHENPLIVHGYPKGPKLLSKDLGEM